MRADVFASAFPALVEIRCEDLGRKGSGFLASPDGRILTNNHVVAQYIVADGGIHTQYSSRIHVLANGQVYQARLLNSASAYEPIVFDYAILKIDAPGPTNYLELSDLTAVRCGDEVLCLGFPLDFTQVVATHGIISAIVSRTSHVNTVHSMRTIVTDAVTQFGSSGGPMIHVPSGKVIGINTLRHPINDEIGQRLLDWSSQRDATAFALIRDLVKYTLKHTYVGLNHAVSVEYALKDPAF